MLGINQNKALTQVIEQIERNFSNVSNNDVPSNRPHP